MASVLKFISRGEAATRRIAARALREFRDRRPLVLALSGELGSGKTTFVRGLARSLGIRGRIQSPTFVLMKWHRTPAVRGRVRPYSHFIHVDVYRIESLAEARRLGLRDAFCDPRAVVVVEWADRVRKLIPRNAVWIRFAHKSKEERLIQMTNV